MTIYKLSLICFLVLVSACSSSIGLNQDEQNNTMKSLDLYFNKETGAQFVARTQANLDNPLPTSNTTFYDLDWDKKTH